jgi:hypothetical protein
MSAFDRLPTLVPPNFPSSAYQLEAMINVLERKGILTLKEVLDELEVIAATKGKEEVNWSRVIRGPVF